jgi:hypothetical protein
MKPLHSLLLLASLIPNALGLSRVAVPGTYSSTYQNRTFNYNVIQAFAHLNGTWTPEIRSYTTLEDLASILPGQSAFLSNATNYSNYTDRRSHHLHSPALRRHHHHGSSLDHRSSRSTSNVLVTREKEPKAVFAHFMVSLPTYVMLLVLPLPLPDGTPLRLFSSSQNHPPSLNYAVNIVSDQPS